MKRSELKFLIKEHIKTLMEGDSITDTLKLGEFQDSLIITQSGGQGDFSTQKVQISKNDLPKLLDSIFNKVPVDTFPVEYRKSFISKLADGIANSETEFSNEQPEKDNEGDTEGEPKDTGLPTTPEEDAALADEPEAEEPKKEEPLAEIVKKILNGKNKSIRRI